jgi:hypothetical protein
VCRRRSTARYITSAGHGFDGSQPVTGQNILAQANPAAARAKRFVADIKKLQGKVAGAYLSQLAQKGPDALPEAEALLTLSKLELAKFAGRQDVAGELG